MNIDKKLADLLRCPVTGQALRVVEKSRLEEINQAAAAGSLAHPDGRPAEGRLEAALVTADGARVYPVRDGIPVMLEEESVVLPEAGGTG